MNIKNKAKRIFSGIIAAGMIASVIPTVSFAAQSNEYTDPADVWMTSNSRTNELDINATTTYETFFCPVCDMETNMLVYRVPEYTKSGDTALNRGVKFSDGTMIDGTGKGNVDDGTPGVDAKYTGYHYTKAVCQNCGIINANEGTGSYAFGKNVYSLYSCDSDFFLDFDSTTYLPYNSKYHTEIYKAGKYCQYCKGTHAEAEEHREAHSFDDTVESELGNQRFHVTGVCDDCGYTKNEYVAAKSVIESYYGKVDGKAHTVTLSDLSEDGVHTQIRFGTKANECTLTSAPSYTDDGYYPVYYEIDYKYGDVSMTENGVSYVWLLDNGSSENSALSSVHVHDYRFLETVRPTCTELGYDCFQCNECGALMKTNYVPATGHDYDTVVIREASCQQGGLVLHICKDCGSHYTENTSMIDHKYATNTIAPTCTMNGYTEHVCIDCGFKYITDLTPLAKHDYRPMITPPTCTEHGYVTYICTECGDTYTSDYTEPTGHDWDNGHVVTSSTCDSEGVMEYHCKKCDGKMIQAISAKGHKAGPEATCTEPQICTECGAVLELPKGHNYSETITPPTCETMGFSTYVCNDCGVSYVGNYTDPLGHNYAELIVPPTCTEIGYSIFTCSRCGEQYIGNEKAKLPHDYIKTVTEPTCTELGYTVYECVYCLL